jgi:hypothetical protein
MSNPFRRTHARALALVASGLVAGGVLAGAFTANAADNSDDSSSSSSSSSSSAPSTAKPANPNAGDPSKAQRADETVLTGDTAQSVKDAVLAKYPGATFVRVETDSDGVYEAHITKADGTATTVELDKSFAITGEEAGGPGGGGPGGHDGRGGHGGPGGANEADDQGADTADTADSAALSS